MLADGWGACFLKINKAMHKGVSANDDLSPADPAASVLLRVIERNPKVVVEG